MRTSVRAAALVVLLSLLTISAPVRPVAAAVAPAARPLAPLAAAQLSHRMSAEVFGYLPYWSIGSWTDSYLRYDLLTTIALFGVPVNDDGTLVTASPGYQAIMSATATEIIAHAHAAGVRVVITFESFGVSHNAAFFSSAAAQQTFVAQATALMRSRGADGANLDVELIAGSYFPAYGRLVGALRAASRATNPIAQISVATNGNSSGSSMAATAVTNGADLAFLMGYSYRSGGTSPVGSIDPIVRTDGGLSLTGSLNLYAAAGVPANRIVLGLPYYGMTWPTLDAALHGQRQPSVAGLGAGVAFFPSSLPTGIPSTATLDRDPVELSSRATWYDATTKTWYQTYVDDPASLAPKERLVVERALAGMGIWALGYDRGRSGYWEAIATNFQGPRLTALRIAPDPTRLTGVAVTASWLAGANPVISARYSNDGRTWSPWRPVASTAAWTIPAGDGRKTVWAEVADSAGAISPARPAATLLDSHPPAMTSLAMTYQWSYHRWLIRYAAKDALSGVRYYQVSYRVGRGSWRSLVVGASRIAYLKLPYWNHVQVSVRAVDWAGNVSAWRSVRH